MTKAKNGLGLGDDIDPDVKPKRKIYIFCCSALFGYYIYSVYILSFFVFYSSPNFSLFLKQTYFLYILTSLELDCLGIALSHVAERKLAS